MFAGERRFRLRTVRLTGALAVIVCIASTLPMVAASQAGNPDFMRLAEKAKKASDEGRLDDAARLYAQALALRPKWVDGWWALGTLEYDRDHYAKAAADFRKLVVLQSNNGMAHAMLGLSEFELGHEGSALQHIQKGKNIGLTKDVDFWHVVLYHEGVLLQRKGGFEAAKETLEELCLQGVQSNEVTNALGMTMLRLTAKNPPSAGTVEADVIPRVGRAECLAGQKKYEEARPLFDRVTKDNPSFPNIHYAYGLFLLELRELPNAIEELNLEVKNNPAHILARLRIAAILYKEDSAAGIPYAEEAVKMEPKLGFAHYLLGLLLLDTDKYEQALPELEIAQKSFPREAKLYFALGSAYSRAGRKQDAVRARAMFEKLTREGAASSLGGEEQGLRGKQPESITPPGSPQ